MLWTIIFGCITHSTYGLSNGSFSFSNRAYQMPNAEKLIGIAVHVSPETRLRYQMTQVMNSTQPTVNFTSVRAAINGHLKNSNTNFRTEAPRKNGTKQAIDRRSGGIGLIDVTLQNIAPEMVSLDAQMVPQVGPEPRFEPPHPDVAYPDKPHRQTVQDNAVQANQDFGPYFPGTFSPIPTADVWVPRPTGIPRSVPLSKCKGRTGYVADLEHNCQTFFNCLPDGSFDKLSCPAGLMFDQTTLSCQKSTGVVCSAENIFDCTGKTGFYSDPFSNDRSSYFFCINGEKSHFRCPDGLFFNENCGACDLPQNCGPVSPASYMLSGPFSRQTSQAALDKLAKESSQIPGRSGLVSSQDGPSAANDGLTAVNVDPTLVSPIARSESIGVNMINDFQSSSEFDCSGRYGLFADISSGCTSYWVCMPTGTGHRLQCPAHLRFNELLGACDWPERVSCSSLMIMECMCDMAGFFQRSIQHIACQLCGRVPPAPNQSLLGTPPSALRIYGRDLPMRVKVNGGFCADKIGFYPDPTSSCKSYYFCSAEGRTYNFTCPGVLMYNEVNGACDDPQNVNCLTARIIEGFDCAGKMGLFSDVGQGCRVYYSCNAYGKKTRLQCPEYQMFNERSGICDIERNVLCGPDGSTTALELGNGLDSRSNVIVPITTGNLPTTPMTNLYGPNNFNEASITEFRERQMSNGGSGILNHQQPPQGMGTDFSQINNIPSINVFQSQQNPSLSPPQQSFDFGFQESQSSQNQNGGGQNNQRPNQEFFNQMSQSPQLSQQNGNNFPPQVSNNQDQFFGNQGANPKPSQEQPNFFQQQTSGQQPQQETQPSFPHSQSDFSSFQSQSHNRPPHSSGDSQFHSGSSLPFNSDQSVMGINKNSFPAQSPFNGPHNLHEIAPLFIPNQSPQTSVSPFIEQPPRLQERFLEEIPVDPQVNSNVGSASIFPSLTVQQKSDGTGISVGLAFGQSNQQVPQIPHPNAQNGVVEHNMADPQNSHNNPLPMNQPSSMDVGQNAVFSSVSNEKQTNMFPQMDTALGQSDNNAPKNTPNGNSEISAIEGRQLGYNAQQNTVQNTVQNYGSRANPLGQQHNYASVSTQNQHPVYGANNAQNQQNPASGNTMYQFQNHDVGASHSDYGSQAQGYNPNSGNLNGIAYGAQTPVGYGSQNMAQQGNGVSQSQIYGSSPQSSNQQHPIYAPPQAQNPVSLPIGSDYGNSINQQYQSAQNSLAPNIGTSGYHDTQQGYQQSYAPLDSGSLQGGPQMDVHGTGQPSTQNSYGTDTSYQQPQRPVIQAATGYFASLPQSGYSVQQGNLQSQGQGLYGATHGPVQGTYSSGQEYSQGDYSSGHSAGNYNSGQNVGDFSCRGLIGYYPDVNDDCRVYYYCKADGSKFQFRCPADLKYNATIGVCDWPRNVMCALQRSGPGNTPTWHESPFFDCQGRVGFFGDSAREYRVFYYCEKDGRKHRFVCPSNLRFNDARAACDWPENIFKGPYVGEQEFDCSGKRGYFGNSNTPSVYYFCEHDGTPKKYVCSDRLVFNFQIGSCDWPERIHNSEGSPTYRSALLSDGTRGKEAAIGMSIRPMDAQESQVKQSFMKSPLPKTIKCATGKYGFFADFTSSCQKYFYCRVDGKNFSFTCPNNLRFNEKLGACDLERNVPCLTSSSQGFAQLAVQKTFYDCKGKTGLVPDMDEACRTFFNCEPDGSFVTFACSEGLLFNTLVGACDRAETVQCKAKKPKLTTKHTTKHTTKRKSKT